MNTYRVSQAASASARKIIPTTAPPAVNVTVRRSPALATGLAMTAATVAGGLVALRRGSVTGSTQIMAQGSTLAIMLTSAMVVKDSTHRDE